ncbi:MAG: MYXO-CTERM sorting domain-containing protein [Bacteroidota bacterium]
MQKQGISACCTLAALLLFLLPLSGAAQQRPTTGVPIYYKLKQVYLPEERRQEVRYDLKQLELRNVGGQLPTTDGEQFQVNVFKQKISSATEAKRMVTNMMRSLNTPLQMDKDLRMNINKTIAKSDERFIDQQVKSGVDSTKKRISGKFSTVGKSSEEMLKESADEVKKQAKVSVAVYRFDQYFDNTIIDNTAISLAERSEQQLVSVHGRFYNTVRVTNKKALAYKEALAKGIAQLKADNKYDKITLGQEKETLVLLPYEDGFKYAWKTQIIADGPYRVWVDTETGHVLQLLPEFFFSDNARGLAFNPSPNEGTTEMTFEVDAPSDGKYTLRKSGVLTLSNSGADGTSGILTINDDGSGTANFNVSPINGTVVERTNQAGYNGQFQQVNLYAHLFNQRKYYMLVGSQDFGQIDATFNGAGNNAFCCPPNLLLGMASTSASTDCGDVFNSAIDATVITHEFGHFLNGLQYGVGGGTLTGAINEGLADFWACTNFNIDTFGGWWGHNCPAPVQSGFTPRQSEPLDIFPDRNALAGASNEIHSAGQIISWANWSARQGMNDASGLGTLSINLNIIRAMTTAGIGITDTGTDKSIHDSYLDLLKQTVLFYSNSRLINKLLAGYARAGFFLAPQDAVMDIDDSYLDRNSATGPTFTVWTGRDYTFSGSTVSTASPPFNTQFMVEVANDAAFTSNLQTSGWLGGVTAGAGGSATWVLPNAAWTTLKAGSDIYFRLTTRGADESNIRQSWNPGNGFLANTPVGRAAINGTGTKDCACSASSGTNSTAMALIPLAPLALLLSFRRKFRNNTATNDADKNN